MEIYILKRLGHIYILVNDSCKEILCYLPYFRPSYAYLVRQF